jgi:hypothetical protein
VAVVKDENLRVQLGCPFSGGKDELVGGRGGRVIGGLARVEDVEELVGALERVLVDKVVDDELVGIPDVLEAVTQRINIPSPLLEG